MSEFTLELKPHENWIGLDIMLNNKKIGCASVETFKGYLSGFEIFEPYQNQGYGQEALRLLIKDYNVQYLSVDKDNERALHIYKKLGFNVGDYGLYYEMKLITEENS